MLNKLSIFLGFTIIIGCIQNHEEVNQKIETIEDFGHYLFFDKDISYSKQISCSTCHNPEMAFTDGYKLSKNHLAESLNTNSPSILNLNTHRYFSWTDTTVRSLDKQLQRPLYSLEPEEMGWAINSNLNLKRIKKKYNNKIDHLIQDDLNLSFVKSAIIRYEKGLISRNSWYDNYLKGNEVLTEKEKEGMSLFFDMFQCSKCHGGIDFNKPSINLVSTDISNNEKKANIRVPGLRNVSLTAPYFHDGSKEDLAGSIKAHKPYETISEDKLDALIQFLYTLEDTSYLSNPSFVSPFKITF